MNEEISDDVIQEKNDKEIKKENIEKDIPDENNKDKICENEENPNHSMTRVFIEDGGMVTRIHDYVNNLRSHEKMSKVNFVFNVEHKMDPAQDTPKMFKQSMKSKEKQEQINSIKGEFLNFLSRGAWIKVNRNEVKKWVRRY